MEASTTVPVVDEVVDATAEEAPKAKSKFDFDQIRNSPAFWPGVALLAGIVISFWGLLSHLPNLWMNDEYYSHGVLVPLIIGFVLYRWWPRLRQMPVKPVNSALILLAPLAYLNFVATINQVPLIQSLALLATILVGVLFIAGWKWAFSMSLPIVYFAFALPLWQPIVDNYTNPMQLISAKVSHQLLELFGYSPISLDTLILVNNFKMDVGVPCSGLKLVIALMAFTVFFVMVGGLKWWGNLMMLASAFPLAVFINGLRIALIGVVGDSFGDEAGHQFHDYSGYITLIVCFLILFKFARLLGWKD